MSLDEFFLELRRKYLNNQAESREDLSILAHQYYNQGDYDKAAPFFEQILALDQYTLGPDDPDTATSLNNLAGLYYKQGDYAKAEPLYTRALVLYEKALGPDHPSTATSLNNLAGLCRDQGDYAKAESLYMRALAIWGKALGPDHPETARSLNNLAGLYNRQGDYAKAESFYMRALTIWEKALGPDHPETARSLNNLAGLYRIQGDYAKAVPLCTRSLAIWEKALGPDHPDTATSLNNLADLYQGQGDYAKAEPLYTRALAIWERALGPDHRRTATSLNNLAVLYRDQGDYAKAEPLCTRALAIWERALGPNHPDTAMSLNNLAGLYRDQGDYAKAEPLYTRALAIWERALRPGHPDTAMGLNNLAGLYNRQGDYAKAEPLYTRALAIYEKALGPDHPSTATSLNNLALLYREQGDYAKAEPLYTRALAIREKTLGPDHPGTAMSIHNLADLYNRQGNYVRAVPLYKRALAISERALGPDHPDTARNLNNLALLYHDQGDYDKVEPLYTRALAICEKALGLDHPDTATSLNNLAGLYNRQGHHAKAEPLHRRALAITEKAMGPDHPSTAAILNNLAWLYYNQGDYAKAEPLYTRALAIYEKALGPNHPSTAMSLNNLAELYYNQGDYAKAEPLHTRALAIREKALGPEHPDTVWSLVSLSWNQFSQANITESHYYLNIALRREMRWLTREIPLLTLSKRTSFIRQYLIKDNFLPNIALSCDELTSSALWCRFNRYGLLQEIERRQLLLTGLSGTWADRVQTLRRLINQLATTSLNRDRRQQLEQEREEIEAELFRSFPQLGFPIVEVEEVVAALPTAGMLIEFQRFTPIKSSEDGDNPAARYVALLLTAGASSRAVDLGPAQLLEQASEDALQASADELDDAAMLWMAVSEQLLSPLKEHLNGIEKCFLCPDAELHRIPFTALPSPWAPGRLLAEVCQIHVIASARQLLTASESPVDGNRPLVVADPTFDQPGAPISPAHGSMANQHRSRDMGSLATWGPLPATAVEGRQVAECLSGSLLLAEEASARNLQQTCHPRVLHVATHGYFLPDQDNEETRTRGRTFLAEPSVDLLASFRGEDPMLRSGLVLAGANNPHGDPDDDGYLTALEATHLDLQGTELVTLSACDTGRGDIHTGEGVYGLQRALIVAGARSTLLSLWKVPDEATCDFMVRFYTRLKEGMGRSDALLTVQREFRQHENLAWRHHCYWAAWQLVGDWRTIQGL